jgi:hypothetical protein
MRYVIVSLKLGKSQLSYPTYEDALQAARNAWKHDKTRVGMCAVMPLDPSTHHECSLCGMYDETQSHICLPEYTEEMNAVYLDAIQPY